jgi:hypothetical protein
VPVGIKYRFLDDYDAMPAMLDMMDRLEHRLTWWNRPDLPLVERIYRFGEALIALKEIEYLGSTCAGSLPERIAHLRSTLLDGLEDRRLGKRHESVDVPSRVKELRKHCLEILQEPSTTPETAAVTRKDLNDLFVALQLFSYPGDYLREAPTVERVAEVLMKCEEDFLDSEFGSVLGPRRVSMSIGEPIDVGALLRAGGKLKTVVATVTADLEGRIQSLLDAIPPGRPLPAAKSANPLDTRT